MHPGIMPLFRIVLVAVGHKTPEDKEQRKDPRHQNSGRFQEKQVESHQNCKDCAVLALPKKFAASYVMSIMSANIWQGQLLAAEQLQEMHFHLGKFPEKKLLCV